MKNLILLLSLLWLTACSSISVRPDPIAGIALAQYSSFRIGTGQVLDAQGSHERGTINDFIEHSLREALLGKGLKEAPEQAPMVVNYVVGTQTGNDSQKLPSMVTYDRDSGWWNLGARSWARGYTDSGMIIELRDHETQQLLWRAFIQGELSRHSSGRKLHQAIHKAFHDYPALKSSSP